MNLNSFYPPYAINRVLQMRFARANPWAPWLTPSAITAIQGLLKPNDIGFEFGSGRSTIWLGGRVRLLYSVEHSPGWYNRVRDQLERAKLMHKVNYHLALNSGHIGNDFAAPDDHPYLRAMAEMPDDHFDFVLVDGIMRLSCLRLSVRKLKPGGILILDNADRYLPNRYEEGYTTLVHRRDHPKDDQWSRTWSELSSWRGFSTTDRICETRFMIKP
jgi:SAM-dependent methyltransferase